MAPKPTRARFHCCSSALATVPQFRSIRPQLWQLKYCRQGTAVAMEASPGGFGRLLAVLDGEKSSWAEKSFFRKKNGHMGVHGVWQLKYRFQSTAAAMEASPGGFGGLFGCS